MLQGKGLKVGIAFMLGLASLGGCASPTPSHTIPSETPTGTPTPAPITGNVTGRLVGYISNEPKVAATVIMCPMTGSGQYKFVASFSTNTDNSGFFRLAELPPGQYAIVYGLQDEIKPNWKQLDGKILEYKEPPEGSFYGASLNRDFIETFGGTHLWFRVSEGQSSAEIEHLELLGGSLEYRKYTIIRSECLWTSDGVLWIREGALYSELLGLTMEFMSGKPVTVEIVPDKTANIEIKVTEVFKRGTAEMRQR